MHTGVLGDPAKQRLKDLWKVRVVGRRDVARVIAVGPWLADLARRRGMPAAKVVTIPNALVLERFADLPSRSEARERLGLAPDAFVVLGLCWWPSVKGADVLVDALEAANHRGVSLAGLLVGEDDLRAFLADRFGAQRPGWLHDSPFVADPGWLYAAADVFVSASRHEGFGYSLGEAMACGLPAIMSDIVGTRFYGAAGGVRAFASGDAAALADALASVAVQAPQARAALGADNATWVGDHLGIDGWCAAMLELYDDLLPVAGGRR
jgi:glycosyltransferase involved in cell wall biosynthesis